MAITKATNSGLVGTKYNNVSADNYYMEPISKVTVGSGGVSSVQFSNIPSNYKHLQIRGIAKDNRTTYASDIGLRFNGDSGNNYSWHRAYGFGTSSSISADGYASQSSMNVCMSAGGTVNNSLGLGPLILDILDYTSGVKNKVARSLSGYDDNGQGGIAVCSGGWYNTAPVTSITLVPMIGTVIAQYSQFTLYGIRG
jgi:hypothetical protein